MEIVFSELFMCISRVHRCTSLRNLTCLTPIAGVFDTGVATKAKHGYRMYSTWNIVQIIAVHFIGVDFYIAKK